MKNVNRVLWGLVIIAIGVLIALKAFDVINVNIFFDGWWTLIIIVPSLIGLFSERDKVSNLICLAIGVFLLLCCQGVLSFAVLWKLFIPAVIVVIGLKMVIGGIFGNKARNMIDQMKSDGVQPKVGCAVFSGSDVNYHGQVFDGAELTAVFGGVTCDLREAIIEKDCAIQVSAIFGGVDILVPPHVQVKVNANSLFGGISNKTTADKTAAATLHVSGTCMFGGVEIK